jgi:molybdopterin-guanine dinucleotide biosynthesis protein A
MTAGPPLPMYDGVVLAGGAARRLDGADKPGLLLADRALLDRVLDALVDAATTIVVGPARTTARRVLWTREDPPGGGPVAALAAGMALVENPAVVVLAADLPFVGSAVRPLLKALGDQDAAVLVDRAGRLQPLVAAYRTAALRAALAAQRTVDGASMRSLLAAVSVVPVPDPGGARPAAHDCDTWGDLDRARQLLEETR